MRKDRMRVTAHMRTGVVSDGYMPLDSILHYQMMYHRFGAEEVTLPGELAYYGSDHGSVPLVRKMANGVWFYAASFAQWEAPYIDDKSFWVKKFDMAHSDMVDFGGKSARIDTSSGTYKGYNMPIFLRHTLSVRWYAVGNMERVRELLGDATHIGKKTSQGWGRVNQWEVEPWEWDWSIYRDGKATRALPAPSGTLYGVRPPYWKPGNQTLCRLPAQY